MTITENDFIEKMIEIAKTGYENMTQRDPHMTKVTCFQTL